VSIRRTKIVCTLGPASETPETIGQMIRAGMDVARLNTSHGTIGEHIERLKIIREVAEKERRHVGVLMDLGGPKLRTGPVRDPEGIMLRTGERITVVSERVISEPSRIGIDYARLAADVHDGDRILVNDGAILLAVEQVGDFGLLCKVMHGGLLTANRGVSFPDSRLHLNALTERDRQYISVGVDSGVDFFALSFVGSVEDVTEAKSIIAFLGEETPVIAKIERRRAVENLDAIAAVSDGLMVARGDLGVELSPEDVPVQQRRIIAAAARHLIPAITATQMLESMTDQPRPTRAESSDVAHAVWDVSDAVMLSGETAVGKYPVESVRMMDRIIRSAEAAEPNVIPPQVQLATDNHAYTVALAARRIVEFDHQMKGIACFTRSGYTAGLLSKVYPGPPIYALSPTEGVCRQLALSRGVVPVLVPFVEHSEEMLRIVDRAMVQNGLGAEGDEVVIVASLPVRAVGRTNFLKLHRLGEGMDEGEGTGRQD
jgi:pyruvate kinase